MTSQQQEFSFGNLAMKDIFREYIRSGRYRASCTITVCVHKEEEVTVYVGEKRCLRQL